MITRGDNKKPSQAIPRLYFSIHKYGWFWVIGKHTGHPSKPGFVTFSSFGRADEWRLKAIGLFRVYTPDSLDAIRKRESKQKK